MDLNRLRNLAISETGFLFDPTTGNTYTLNETAVFILKALRDGTPAGSIAIELSNQYEVSAESAADDVSDALLQLREAGLVAG